MLDSIPRVTRILSLTPTKLESDSGVYGDDGSTCKWSLASELQRIWTPSSAAIWHTGTQLWNGSFFLSCNSCFICLLSGCFIFRMVRQVPLMLPGGLSNWNECMETSHKHLQSRAVRLLCQRREHRLELWRRVMHSISQSALTFQLFPCRLRCTGQHAEDMSLSIPCISELTLENTLFFPMSYLSERPPYNRWILRWSRL